jgi:hypothetical protein
MIRCHCYLDQPANPDCDLHGDWPVWLGAVQVAAGTGRCTIQAACDEDCAQIIAHAPEFFARKAKAP